MDDQAFPTSQHGILSQNQPQFQHYLNRTLQLKNEAPDNEGIPEDTDTQSQPPDHVCTLTYPQKFSMTPTIPSFTSEECAELGPSVPILKSCQEIIEMLPTGSASAIGMGDRGFVVDFRFGEEEDEDRIRNVWEGTITTRSSSGPSSSSRSASNRGGGTTMYQHLLDGSITSRGRDQSNWTCNLRLLQTTHSNRDRSNPRPNARSINDLDTRGGWLLSDPEFSRHLDTTSEICSVIPSSASSTVDQLTASWQLGESDCEIRQTLLSEEDPGTFVTDISIWKGSRPSSPSGFWGKCCTIL